jgi:hypothetical protein
VESNGLQVQTTVKVDGSDNVSCKEILVQYSGEPEEQQEYTHCSVGTMPLPGLLAPGVAAGVAGVTPLPLVAFPPCCWPFTAPFAACPPAAMIPSFSEDGGVRSPVPAPPGKDREAGEVKALAWCALDGWVVSVSMVTGFAILKLTTSRY